MVLTEDAIERIMDMYGFREFLEVIMSYDHLASEVIELTEVDNAEEAPE